MNKPSDKQVRISDGEIISAFSNGMGPDDHIPTHQPHAPLLTNEQIIWVVRRFIAGSRFTLSARGDNTGLMMQVETLRALVDNWDSYGAEHFDPRTIALAMQVASHLGEEWQCVPCADGPSVWLYRGDEEEIIEVRTSYVGEKK